MALLFQQKGTLNLMVSALAQLRFLMPAGLVLALPLRQAPLKKNPLLLCTKPQDMPKTVITGGITGQLILQRALPPVTIVVKLLLWGYLVQATLLRLLIFRKNPKHKKMLNLVMLLQTL